MRSLALRAALVGLLVTTAASKAQLALTDPPDMRAAVVRLAEHNGLLVSNSADGQADALGDPITFQTPDCEDFGQIFLVELGLQSLPMLNHVIDRGYTRQFVYLGRTWTRHDRLGMRLEWLKQKPLALVGVGKYNVNESALLIAEPPDCDRAGRIDWSTLWARRP